MPKRFLLSCSSSLSMNVPPNPRKRLLRSALLDFADVIALQPPQQPSPGCALNSPVNLSSPPIRLEPTPDYFHDVPLPAPLGFHAAPEPVESSPQKRLCTTKFTCKLCSLNFSDPFSLARHVCAAIRPVEYRCPECDKVFNNPANLASHRRWHKPSAQQQQQQQQQQLHCPHCNMLFRRNSLLKKHIEAEHYLHQHRNMNAIGASQTSGRLQQVQSSSHFISHIQGLAHHPESPFIPVPSLH